MDSPTAAEMWAFLLQGYLLTVLIELPVLWFGLSPRHSRSTRIAAGFWLTACTYPVVILVLPLTVWRWSGYGVYLLIAETFAPVAEVVLFQWTIPPVTTNPLGTTADSFAILSPLWQRTSPHFCWGWVSCHWSF